MSKQETLRGVNPKTGKPWPTHELVLVTPELASEWLEANLHNRSFNQKQVDKFISILNAGDWHLTTDAVGFDWNGVMTNGQHRVSGIFLSGISAPMFVDRGLDPESQLVTDQGKNRAIHEQLSLTDDAHYTKQQIAVLRAMAGGMEGTSSKMVPQTISDVRRFFGRHYNAIMLADEMLGQSTRKGVSSAGVKAVIARASYHVESEKLKVFCHILKHGTNPDGQLLTTENAPVLLRDTLIKGVRIGARTRQQARELYARTERALQAFLTGRQLVHRISPVTEELYPLPEEQAALQARRKEENKKPPKPKNWARKIKVVKAQN